MYGIRKREEKGKDGLGSWDGVTMKNAEEEGERESSG